ncbi:hypothetical protein [Aureimonas psammosilenae]|uniref:hypothetical protein n=1 Tax=Aureimonas psammosilenae TaxID=2495496 RepID=UPI001260C659|nr:hypothetical protein [Aureimonas psammosilenae]
MAWDFRPGMRVVCVDDQHTNRYDVSEIVKGSIYTICWVGEGQMQSGEFVVAVRLVEVPSRLSVRGQPSDKPFRASRFRPVREANIDCLRAHLEPRNVEVAA